MVNAGFVAPPPASPAPPPSPPPNVLLMLDLENYEKGSITFQVHLPYISPTSPVHLPYVSPKRQGLDHRPGVARGRDAP